MFISTPRPLPHRTPTSPSTRPSDTLISLRQKRHQNRPGPAHKLRLRPSEQKHPSAAAASAARAASPGPHIWACSRSRCCTESRCCRSESQKRHEGGAPSSTGFAALGEDERRHECLAWFTATRIFSPASARKMHESLLYLFCQLVSCWQLSEFLSLCRSATGAQRRLEMHLLCTSTGSTGPHYVMSQKFLVSLLQLHCYKFVLIISTNRC